MYYRSGGLIIVVSLIMALIGYWRLWRVGRKKVFFMFLIGIAAFPILFSLVLKISDDHLRLWVGVPVICLIPFWLIAGFFIYNAAENEISKNVNDRTNILPESASTFITKTRIFGLILSLIGIILWIYGATHPEMTKMIEILVLGGFSYSMLIGLCWLISGKRIGEML